MKTTQSQKHALCMAATLLALAAAVSAHAGGLVAKPYRTGDEKRVDNPVDVWMHALSGAGGKAVEGPAPYRNADRWAGRFEILDATDSRHGDFSVVLTVASPEKEKAFGFSAGPFTHHWMLSRDFSLHLWVKVVAEGAAGPWTLALYDSAGRRAAAVLDSLSAQGERMRQGRT